ncbi:uncharacterized protein [Amphiura filiformis]|uniref:uncharacterized protein n=1 Tax=Amphiura filiformis TaxID=82378 RepID=UPI003B2176E0
MVLAMAVMYLASNMVFESSYDYMYRDYLVFSKIPFWAGLCFYLVTGIIGLQVARKQTKCSVIAYMTMSIIASTVAGGQVICEIFAALFSYYCREQDQPPYDVSCSPIIGLQVCHSLAALIGFVEMVIAIVSAAFCCHGVCCGQSENSQSYSSQTPMVVVPVHQSTAKP